MNKSTKTLFAVVAAIAVALYVVAWMYGRSWASSPLPDVRTVRHGTIAGYAAPTAGREFGTYTIRTDVQEVPCAKGVKGPCTTGSSWIVGDAPSTPNIDVLRRVGVNGRVIMVMKNGKLESIAEAF